MTNHTTSQNMTDNKQSKAKNHHMQSDKKAYQSIRPITIKSCAAKPQSKRIPVKSSVGKTTEAPAFLYNISNTNRYFGVNFINITAFFHKKYSPVTSCVTLSVTLCHRAVTLWSRSVTLCPITRNGTCNAMCNVHVTLPVTETLQIIFCIFILLHSFLLFP